MIRSSPASASACALRGSSDAFVVSVSSASSAREHRDQLLDVAPDERLAAGEPELLARRAPTAARATRVISSKSSSSLPVEEPVVVAEDLLRHAVRAAEVAAVGDRDPQVAKGTAEGVESLRHLRTDYRGDPADVTNCSQADYVATPAAVPALIAVTAVWGLTFVQVKDAVARLPALPLPRAPVRDRDARRSRRSRPARAARPRAARRGRRRRSPAALLAAGYTLQTLGLERTTVSSAGLRHRDVRRADAADRVRLLPDPDRPRRRGAASRSRPSGSRCSRASTAAALGGDLLVLARRGRLLAPDRADGALRAALRRARVHARRDARRLRGCSASSRSPTLERAARLDGLGRAARDRDLRERARASSSRRGRSGGRAPPGPRSSSRSSRSGRRSSATRSPATGSAPSAWAGCAAIMAGIVLAEPRRTRSARLRRAAPSVA